MKKGQDDIIATAGVNQVKVMTGCIPMRMSVILTENSIKKINRTIMTTKIIKNAWLTLACELFKCYNHLMMCVALLDQEAVHSHQQEMLMRRKKRMSFKKKKIWEGRIKVV